jgi:WD40 repeat protein
VAFSPDGQRIVTGSWDHTAKVWEAASELEVLTLTRHNSQIFSVAFSSDGQRIITGSSDQTAKVWEAANGRELLTLRGHSAGIRSVAFSPDGQRIVTGSSDQTAKVWEAPWPELLTSGDAGLIFLWPFPRMASGFTGSWDQRPRCGRPPVVGNAHAHGAQRLDFFLWPFSPTASGLLAVAISGKVWDAASGRELLRSGHSAQILTAAFSRTASGLSLAVESDSQSGRRPAVGTAHAQGAQRSDWPWFFPGRPADCHRQ